MEKLLGLPVIASKHGQDVDNLIVWVHWLMAVLFVGWIIYFFYALFRFRKSRNPKADYVGVRNHASSYVEVGVAGVEAVLLMFVAVPLWAKMVDDFPAVSEDPTVVRIVAQQFDWNIIYPGKDKVFGKQDANLVNNSNPLGFVKDDPAHKDDVQTLGELRVPVNKPVIIHLSSKDVIHSLKVIALRICQDAIPGMSIPTHFIPTQIGKYQINCAQLCGNGHYAMSRGRLIVESQEDYDKWLAEKAKGGGATSFE